ncbi:hypothetical protein KY290_006086 [Solanum tuberosum]|uniref:Uncharacterized protein n=1 Tax=Solanum tuberosum TaxID=4113 RepID=A0ABQ7WFZ4_SOLTU|nr:hypothetical protein KY284_006198 [Solanum tuberosum]KAH0779659.1 hypothetical protein KY290_006086 [Solanum tuberosum]
MVQKIGFHLLLLFIFATIISTASSSRILKESIDETSDFDLPAQDASDITDEELSIARRIDLVLDYANAGANDQHKPKP